MTKRYFNEANASPVFDIFGSILKKFKTDDLIILGLILFLMSDKCDDKELLLLLGFLFVSG